MGYTHLKSGIVNNDISYTSFSDKDDKNTINFLTMNKDGNAFIKTIVLSINDLLKTEENKEEVIIDATIEADKESYKLGETATYKLHLSSDKIQNMDSLLKSYIEFEFNENINMDNYDIQSVLLNNEKLTDKIMKLDIMIMDLHYNLQM